MRQAVTIIGIAGILLGCGGASSSGDTEEEAKNGTRLGRIDDGSRCDAKSGREDLVDLNQDGRPDVRKIYRTVNETEVLICRETDLNYDGVKDFFIFFDDTGTKIRDEADLDFDNKVDIISTYAKGQVIKQELDTNSDGKVDRVRHLKNALPFRVEGDADGDGRVDLWEYYEEGKLVRIGTDEDGDGRADTWSRDEGTLPSDDEDPGAPSTDSRSDPDNNSNAVIAEEKSESVETDNSRKDKAEKTPKNAAAKNKKKKSSEKASSNSADSSSDKKE